MTRLPRASAEDVLRALQRDGWRIARQKGSHAQLVHPAKPGHVTVAIHSRGTIRPRTLLSILEQAGLTVGELRRLL